MNGDGVADLAVTNPGWHIDGAGTVGRVAVFHGPVTGSLMETSSDAAVLGTSNTMYLGFDSHSLAGPGDIDGDGREDLLILHAEEHDGGNAYAGAAYLIGGDALSGDLELLLAAGKLVGAAAGDALGAYGGAGVGDVDGDGDDDLLVGATGSALAGTGSGAAYLITETVRGTQYVTDSAQATFLGDGTYHGAGAGLAGGFDLTGDGMLDLLVSAAGANGEEAGAGATYIVPALGF